jgi:hypothetical protein
MLLRSALRARLGIRERLTGVVLRLWACAAVAVVGAWGVKGLVLSAHPWTMAALVLGTFALIYVAMTAAVRIEEARTLLARLSRSR